MITPEPTTSRAQPPSAAGSLVDRHLNLPPAQQRTLIVLSHEGFDDRGGTAGAVPLIESKLAPLSRELSLSVDFRPAIPFARGDVGPDPRARYIDSIAAYTGHAVERFSAAATEAIATGARLFSVGGNHLRATELAAFPGVCELHGRIPALFWIDAHLDLQTPAETESGNVHGMVASVPLGHGPKALLEYLDKNPGIDPANVVFLGTNAVDAGELKLLHELGVKVISILDIDLDLGLYRWREAVDEISSRLGDKMLAAAELDTDVLANGAVMANNWAMTEREVRSAVVYLSGLGSRFLGLGVSELAPGAPGAEAAASFMTELALTLHGMPNTTYVRHMLENNVDAERGDTEGTVTPSAGEHRAQGGRISRFVAWGGALAASLAIGIGLGRSFSGSDTSKQSEAEGPGPVAARLRDRQDIFTAVPENSRFVPPLFRASSFDDESLLRGQVEAYRSGRATGDPLESGRSTDLLHSYLLLARETGHEPVARRILGKLLGADYLEFAKEHRAFCVAVNRDDVRRFAELWRLNG